MSQINGIVRHCECYRRLINFFYIKAFRNCREVLRPEILAGCARRAVATLRNQWQENPPDEISETAALEAAVQLTMKQADILLSPNLKKVINATGVILHTGLGRAVLSAQARHMLDEILSGYCNLEFDLATGKRGDRHRHVEKLLTELTGAEAACVVNNNAAAVLVTLNTIAERQEIVTSRGQLIEIGGSFRMPDVVEKSGARLVEVGTTNKTKLDDYAKAINVETAGFLVAHTSNYRIVGFTEEVVLSELVQLANDRNLVVVDDLGGGILQDLRQWDLPYEPLVTESVRAGAHLVTFSGDKVLGGPQCGLIVGKRDLIEQVKKNPLTRALRCDKLTLALLEGTLRLFLNPEKLVHEHEVLRMMTEKPSVVKERAQRLQKNLQEKYRDALIAEVRKAESEAGSGTLPLEKIPSYAVTIRLKEYSAATLAQKLRAAQTPVIGYVRDDLVWLDVRTIKDEELSVVGEAFEKLNFSGSFCKEDNLIGKT